MQLRALAYEHTPFHTGMRVRAHNLLTLHVYTQSHTQTYNNTLAHIPADNRCHIFLLFTIYWKAKLGGGR